MCSQYEVSSSLSKFHKEIQEGSVKSVSKSLLENSSLVNETSGDCYITPLAIACRWNQYNIAKLLLQHGANMYKYEYDIIHTALGQAVINNYTNIIQLFFEHHVSNVYSGCLSNAKICIWTTQLKHARNLCKTDNDRKQFDDLIDVYFYVNTKPAVS